MENTTKFMTSEAWIFPWSKELRKAKLIIFLQVFHTWTVAAFPKQPTLKKGRGLLPAPEDKGFPHQVCCVFVDTRSQSLHTSFILLQSFVFFCFGHFQSFAPLCTLAVRCLHAFKLAGTNRLSTAAMNILGLRIKTARSNFEMFGHVLDNLFSFMISLFEKHVAQIGGTLCWSNTTIFSVSSIITSMESAVDSCCTFLEGCYTDLPRNYSLLKLHIHTHTLYIHIYIYIYTHICASEGFPWLTQILHSLQWCDIFFFENMLH